jgi:hypothetical protein
MLEDHVADVAGMVLELGIGVLDERLNRPAQIGPPEGEEGRPRLRQGRDEQAGSRQDGDERNDRVEMVEGHRVIAADRLGLRSVGSWAAFFTAPQSKRRDEAFSSTRNVPIRGCGPAQPRAYFIDVFS